MSTIINDIDNPRAGQDATPVNDTLTAPLSADREVYPIDANKPPWVIAPYLTIDHVQTLDESHAYTAKLVNGQDGWSAFGSSPALSLCRLMDRCTEVGQEEAFIDALVRLGFGEMTDMMDKARAGREAYERGIQSIAEGK